MLRSSTFFSCFFERTCKGENDFTTYTLVKSRSVRNSFYALRVLELRDYICGFVIVFGFDNILLNIT